MEPDRVLNLFDSVWFYLEILEKRPTTLSPDQNPCRQIQENPSKSNVSIHSRSKSHEILYPYNSSPDSALKSRSKNREISLEIPKNPQFKNLNGKKKKFSKSLSELEFEELKGFMDLGFVFSEEDKDSRLVEIIPGLQRLGKKADSDGEKDERESVIESSEERERPYLSEAWEIYEEENMLRKWRARTTNNEVDMKDSLKWWAHTVASAVR